MTGQWRMRTGLAGRTLEDMTHTAAPPYPS
jgi:hypothetical protein